MLFDVCRCLLPVVCCSVFVMCVAVWLLVVACSVSAVRMCCLWAHWSSWIVACCWLCVTRRLLLGVDSCLQFDLVCCLWTVGAFVVGCGCCLVVGVRCVSLFAVCCLLYVAVCWLLSGACCSLFRMCCLLLVIAVAC